MPDFSITFAPKPDAALLIIGHGATVDACSAAPTRAHAAALEKAGLFSQVVTAFWKEAPSIREALAALPQREIYAVPNFISEGYFTRTVIPRELGLPSGAPGSYPLPDGRLLHYCQPVGSHPAMTEMLLQRAQEIAPGIPREEASLIIVGHGTKRNSNSAVAAREQAEKIAAMGIYREVAPAYIDEPPQIAHWQAAVSGNPVVIVPFFIADGLHSYTDIPRMIGLSPLPEEGEDRAAIFLRNPYPVEGRQVYYASAVGTDERFASLILDQVRRHPAP